MLQSILFHMHNVVFSIGSNVSSLTSVLPPKVLFTSGAVLVIGTVTGIVYRHLHNRYIPPGPPSLPILGNLLQVPRQFQSIPFMDWCYQYGALFTPQSTLDALNLSLGPIFSLNLLGQKVVVLNDYKIANDLLGE